MSINNIPDGIGTSPYI